MLSIDPPEVVEDGSSIIWYTMIRPGSEVKLNQFTRTTSITGVLIQVISMHVINELNTNVAMLG